MLINNTFTHHASSSDDLLANDQVEDVLEQNSFDTRINVSRMSKKGVAVMHNLSIEET
jgi:stage III sporulation protein SpoIIIAA